MKVCFVLNRFPELSQTFVLNQVVALLELGHDVELLAAGPAADSVQHAQFLDAQTRFDLTRRTTYTGMPEQLLPRVGRGVAVLARQALRHPLDVARTLNVRRFGWFAATASVLSMAEPLLGRARRYDALVAHFGPQGVVAAALREARLLHGPLTTVYHGYDLSSAPRRAGRNLYRSLFELGEAHLAVSEHGRQRLLALGAPPAKTSVQHMGVDVDELASVNRSSTRRLRLLSIGRLVPKKGFADAVAAVARAARAGVDVGYTILGTGPLQGELQRQIRAERLEGSVRLAGAASQAQVLQALRDSDALVVPSVTAADGDEEGIPMVIMEALAGELPVIATRHGGIPELVLDGECGRLVPEGDVSGLVSAMTQLANDPELRGRLGRVGRRRVVADFNLRSQTQAFAERLQVTANAAAGRRETC